MVPSLGATESYPFTGSAELITDITSTGSTLKANDLVELEEICKVSTRLAVNRSFIKTNSKTIQPWIDKVGDIINEQK